MQNIEQKIDLILQFIERQEIGNRHMEKTMDGIQSHTERLSSMHEKTHQWIEKVGRDILILRQELSDFKVHQFGINETIMESIHEIKDENRFFKRAVNQHEDSIESLMKEMAIMKDLFKSS